MPSGALGCPQVPWPRGFSMQYLGVKGDIVRHSRTGNQNSTKVRPIKIKLKSASEFLNRAKQLRYDGYYCF
jgi:hypothetical protein